MVEYVGFDVSKEETTFCVMDNEGKVLARGKALSDPQSLFEALREHTLCPERVVLETGTSSAWLARGLVARGVPAEIIDARQAHAVMKLQANKTDAKDAELLAEIARIGFCRPVAITSQGAQQDRLLLKARLHLVRQKRDTENAVRGLLGALGVRFPKGSARLVTRVRAALLDHPALAGAISPLLAVIEMPRREIPRLEGRIVERVGQDADCRLLMTVPGVGPITALAFTSGIDDARRFKNSRAVGAYLGLTARRHQSGEMDYTGRISKHGDGLLRSLLYESANCLLTVVRKAHPLKDWARRLKKRGSHKKACVALARKLAVILHRMLVTREAFRWPQAADA